MLRHQELTAHRGKLIDLPLPPAGTPDGSGPQASQASRDAATQADAEALLREILAPSAVDGPQDEVALRDGRRLISGLARPEGLTRPFRPGCARTARTSSPGRSARWAGCCAATSSTGAPGT